MENLDSEEKSRVPALTRGIQILNELQKHRTCTVSQLIKYTNLPRSSVYVLVEELIRLSLIRQNQDGSLQLWMKLISLGKSASDFLNIRDLVVPKLDELLMHTDSLAAHYGLLEDDHAFYAIKMTSPNAVMRILSREGMEVSLVHAGLGKCLLAFQEDKVIERIIKKLDYTPLTPTSIKTPEALLEELHKIRVKGWAFDNSEAESEIRCVAVPIFASDGAQLLGAISLVGTITKFSLTVIDDIVDQVKDCAHKIEALLR